VTVITTFGIACCDHQEASEKLASLIQHRDELATKCQFAYF